MNNLEQAESRAVTASAAAVLVAIGFAGLVIPQHSSFVNALALWSREMQLMVIRCFAAGYHVVGVAIACGMIVAGLVLIGYDHDRV